MSYQLNGKLVPCNSHGALVYRQDWNTDLAKIIAASENIALTRKHWDVIDYLRTEYYVNNGEIPRAADLQSAMEKRWAEPTTCATYARLRELFPGEPVKKGLKIAGLPLA